MMLASTLRLFSGSKETSFLTDTRAGGCFYLVLFYASNLSSWSAFVRRTTVDREAINGSFVTCDHAQFLLASKHDRHPHLTRDYWALSHTRFVLLIRCQQKISSSWSTRQQQKRPRNWSSLSPLPSHRYVSQITSQHTTYHESQSMATCSLIKRNNITA